MRRGKYRLARCTGDAALTKGSLVRRLGVGVGIVISLFAPFWTASVASAADDNSTITVSVYERVKGDNGEDRSPIAGVRVTAVGAITAEALTGSDGKAVLSVPKRGKYSVEIDATTLPKNIEVTDPEALKSAVDFDAGVSIGGGGKSLSIFVGKSVTEADSRLSLLPQTLVNGIKFSLIIAICSIGLSLIYGTTGLTNFTHSEIVTIAGIVTYWLNHSGANLHVLLAAPFGIAAAALLAGGLERQVWRPLRRRGTSLTSMMIVSIGLAIGVRYVYLFFFGGRNHRYTQYVGDPEVTFNLLGAKFGITPRDMGIMVISVVVVLGVSAFLLKARLGKAIRAVSDNPDLASATGINTDRIILIVWILGGALAGLGGVMLGAANGVQWDMGNVILLLMFSAITVGGLGSPFGALIGSFVVGMFTELWTWVFPNVVELKTLGALISLVVILLVRPQGLLGRKERIG